MGSLGYFQGVSPGKGVVPYSGRPERVHTQPLELEDFCDVVCCKQRQSTAQAVPCIVVPVTHVSECHSKPVFALCLLRLTSVALQCQQIWLLSQQTAQGSKATLSESQVAG